MRCSFFYVVLSRAGRLCPFPSALYKQIVQRLAHRRMGVDALPEGMRRDAGVDGDLHEVDHFLRTGAEEMCAEDAVGLYVDDRLEEADWISDYLRLWYGGSFELQHAHIVTCCTCFFLRHADA